MYHYFEQQQWQGESAFNANKPAGESEETEAERCHRFRYAALTLAALHCRFGHRCAFFVSTIHIYFRSRVGEVVRALALHQYGPGLILRPAVICGLSLLFLYSVLRGFALGGLVFPSHQKTNI